MDIRIEPIDLFSAIAAREAGAGVCGSCLMAQALLRADYGSRAIRASVGHRAAQVRTVDRLLTLQISSDAQELISLYDNQDYDRLKALLPRTVRFEVRA